MSRLKAANNAQTALAALMDATATTCTVVSGDILPAVPFRASIDNEIIEVGAKTGNSLSSILRGQEGTTAAAHQSGSLVEARMTAGMHNELVSSGEVSTAKCNFTATIAPGVGDDSGDGYSAGSVWVDVTADAAYICLDATLGAAIWNKITGLVAHALVEAASGTLGHVKIGTGLSIASGVVSAGGFKLVATTHDVSVTGDQAITGAGFTPRAAIILAAIPGTAGVSIGMATASARYCLYNYHYATSYTWDAHTSVLIYLMTAGGVYARATGITMDSDGCTLTWGKVNSPTGTATLMILFIK